MLTLTLSTATNFAPWIEQLALRTRIAAGEAPPSPSELEAAKAAAAKGLDEARMTNARSIEEELVKSLPRGVRIKGLDGGRDGLTVTSKTILEVDRVELIPEIVLSIDENGAPVKPFAAFTVKADKQGFVLSGRTPEFPKESGTLALSIAGTPKPVSHNAQREAGGALQWAGSGCDVRVVFPR